jgi:hypothetical protein
VLSNRPERAGLYHARYAADVGAPRTRRGGPEAASVTTYRLLDRLDYQVLLLEQAPVPAGEHWKLSVPLALTSVNFAESVGDSPTTV